MIIAIIGLTGSGKSTVAKIIAEQRGAYLFDMDYEFPAEYVDRRKNNELVSTIDVKEYQQPMIERILDLENEHDVVMAGFFLDDELPELLQRKTKIVWINLISNNKKILSERISRRSGHFAGAQKILDNNWPNRADQVIGNNFVNSNQNIEMVVADCLSVLDREAL